MASFVAVAKIKFWSSWQGLLWAWYYCKIYFEISSSFLGDFVRNLTELKTVIYFQSPPHIVWPKNGKIRRSSKVHEDIFKLAGLTMGVILSNFWLAVKLSFQIFFSEIYRAWERASRATRPSKNGVKIFTNDGDPSKRNFARRIRRYEGQKLRKHRNVNFVQKSLNFVLFFEVF